MRNNVIYVTSFNERIFKISGIGIIYSFLKTRTEGHLIVYYEDIEDTKYLEMFVKLKFENISFVNLHKYEHLTYFLKKHSKYILEKHGGEKKDDYDLHWNNNWSLWYRKVASLKHAVENHNNCNYLIWVDSDCLFLKCIENSKIADVFQTDNVCFYYLGIRKSLPISSSSGIESGFIGWKNIDNFGLLKKIIEVYDNGQFLSYPRWDDGWIMREIILKSKYKCVDLNTTKQRKCIGRYCKFEGYIIHNKGIHNGREYNTEYAIDDRMVEKYVDFIKTCSLKCTSYDQQCTMQICIARYNENLDWIKNISNNRNVVVYNKGDPIHVPHVTICLENTGREADTWLYHIIQNYDNLTDYTCFLQGDPFDHCPEVLQKLAEFDEKNSSELYVELGKHAKKTTYEFMKKYRRKKDRITKEELNSILKVINMEIDENLRHPIGAQYIVHKKVILKHTLQYYKDLREVVNRIFFGPWIIEKFWPKIWESNNDNPVKDSSDKDSSVKDSSDKDSSDFVITKKNIGSSHSYSIGDTVEFGYLVRRYHPHGSICSKYLKLSNGKPRLWDVLLNIVNEYDKNILPDSDEIVMHLRAGNVVENDVRSVEKLLEKPCKAKGRGLPVQLYVRPLNYHILLQNKYKKKNLNKITIIIGGHLCNRFDKSTEYLNIIVESWESSGFIVKVIKDRHPDDDFVYMCRSKYFISSGGRYSSKVQKMRILGNMNIDDLPCSSYGLTQTITEYMELEKCIINDSIDPTHDPKY